MPAGWAGANAAGGEKDVNTEEGEAVDLQCLLAILVKWIATVVCCSGLLGFTNTKQRSCIGEMDCC